MKEKFCKVCGSTIKFSLVLPERIYAIVDQKIKMDDILEKEYDDTPYLEFYCSTDKAHDIDTVEINEWTEVVRDEFKKYGL